MGITVAELLQNEFFRDFKVLAGQGGLNNQVQGIAVLDAPDGFQWTKNREFVLSSGYVFHENPTLLEQYVKSPEFTAISCLGMKLQRFIKEIPPNILEECNRLKVPLISIPAQVSWMDVINALNVTVMNKNILQFNIEEINPNTFNDLSYSVRKINRILSAIENEMNFPAMLYDFNADKAYYSSEKFKGLADGLKTEDFWNPSFNFSKETLCNSLKMSRYRFYDDRFDKPFSWITVPITVNNKTKAYFVVLEATGLIDYLDQFALRTGFLLIQEIYEQILVAQSIEDIGFEKFIENVLNGTFISRDEIETKANEINLNTKAKCFTIVMKQTNDKIVLAEYRELLKRVARSAMEHAKFRMSVIDDNKCLFLVVKEELMTDHKALVSIHYKMENLSKRLQLEIEGASLVFGLSDKPEDLMSIYQNYLRCEKALSIGPLLYPEDVIWPYSRLGVFAWLEIKEEELTFMVKDLGRLYADEENRELIQTLKVYLECKMNFSLAAKRLYLHINTVRKRIEEAKELIPLDLDDPVSRLKLEVLLKLFF